MRAIRCRLDTRVSSKVVSAFGTQAKLKVKTFPASTDTRVIGRAEVEGAGTPAESGALRRGGIMPAAAQPHVLDALSGNKQENLATLAVCASDVSAIAAAALRVARALLTR